MHKPFGENACVANENSKTLHALYVRKLVQRPQRHAVNERVRFRSSGLKRVCAACSGAFIGKMAQGSTRGLLSHLTLKKFRFFNSASISRQVKFRAIYQSRDDQRDTAVIYTS